MFHHALQRNIFEESPVIIGLWAKTKPRLTRKILSVLMSWGILLLENLDARYIPDLLYKMRATKGMKMLSITEREIELFLYLYL